MSSHYKLAYLPSVYWDGGFRVQIGSASTSTNLNICKNRIVADVDIDLKVLWQGNATMQIFVKVKNNAGAPYSGYLRVYIAEKISSMGWKDNNNQTYHNPFLMFALNNMVTVPANGTYSTSYQWKGALYNSGYGKSFGQVKQNNTFVVASLCDPTAVTRYSSPPSGSPFSAYFVDDTVSAEPVSEPLFVDSDELSQATGGKVNFVLTTSSAFNSRNYFLLGSLSGPVPGIPLPGGLTLPVKWDAYTDLIFQMANSIFFADFTGKLDSNGGATATFDTYGPLPPTMVGLKMYYAFLLYKPFDFVSNYAKVDIVP